MMAGMTAAGAFLRRMWAPVVAVLLMLAAMLLPKLESEERIRVVLSVGPGTEPLIQAAEAGVLPEDRFKVVEVPWTSAVARAVGNGAADVGVVTLDAVLRMRESGQRLRVLMVLNESAGADAVMAREKIADVGGLRGKRVGVDMRGPGAYLLANALESAGMTFEDVETVQLIQPEMKAALQAERVDAVVVSDPLLSMMRPLGLHVVYDSTRLEIPILNLLVASARSHAAHRDRFGELLKAQAEMAVRIRSAAPGGDEETLLRRERLTREQFLEVLGRLRPLAVAGNAEWLSGDPSKLEQMAAKVEGQMLRHGLLLQPPNDAPWIDQELFEEVLK